MTVRWTLAQNEDTADSCLKVLTLVQVPAGVRKEQERGGSPAFAAPVPFAGCSGLQGSHVQGNSCLPQVLSSL